jgi:hypothetical protein
MGSIPVGATLNNHLSGGYFFGIVFSTTLRVEERWTLKKKATR